MLAFGAQLDKGVGLHALMTFMVGLGPLMVLIASFINSKSTWSLSRLDYLCGALSLIGLLFWLITKEGNYAILLGITADLLAGIPTLVKAYKTPETESSPVFLFACASAVITLLTIKTWTFAFVAFPIYIFAICATLYVLIQFKVGNHIRNRISA